MEEKLYNMFVKLCGYWCAISGLGLVALVLLAVGKAAFLMFLNRPLETAVFVLVTAVAYAVVILKAMGDAPLVDADGSIMDQEEL